MGYKVLGFVVWQGARLYFRRRLNGNKRKVVLAGLAAAVVGGVLAARSASRARADRGR